MLASSKNQKQTLILLNSRRSASEAPRHSTSGMFRWLPRRLTLIGLGLTVGVGLPALVYASQQPDTTDATEHSSELNVITPPPPLTGGGVSLQMQTQTSNTIPSSQSPVGQESNNAQVQINGQDVPLTNGSVSKSITDANGNTVDIEVNIDSVSSSQSITSSDGSTKISIESSSSSTGSVTTDSSIRGSPRR